MPTTKDIANLLLTEWDLSDQLEELRGKHHLKKKDLEAYQDQCQEEIRENEKIITQLRQDNWNKRILLAKQEHRDEQVIKTVFKADRQESLCLQQYTAKGALNEMDQKVCEAAKMLNELRHERERRELKLAELEKELDRMTYTEKKCDKKCNAQITVATLENALDKALIKYQTAMSITYRYHEIRDHLKEESLMMPAKLDTMEQALIEQRSGLNNLEVMAKAAQATRDKTRQELARVEQETFESRKTRETELSATKKEAEGRKAEADKVDRRQYARAQLINDGQDQKAIQDQEEKQRTQFDILNYEEAFRLILDSTNVTDLHDIVDCYKTRLERRKVLQNNMKALQGQCDRMKAARDKLIETFKNMKYSGEQTISRGQLILDALERDMGKVKEEKTELQESLNRDGLVLTNIKQGITSLIKLLDPVKLKPPEHNYTTGDVFDQLNLCSKKATQLFNQLNVTVPAESCVLHSLPHEEFAQFMEKRLTSANVRIKLDKRESILSGFSEFDYEGQETGEQAPSRTDIKLQGQKLVDLKTGGKKKQIKKK